MNGTTSASSRLNRRQMLQIGSIGLLNLSLPWLLRAENAADLAGEAHRVD